MKHESKGDVGEDYVNQLAYKSYLKYWCYPNPKDISGDKKEICDLLIPFRDKLIIISVKNHSFDGNYERYKKRVIEKSTNQLNGAERLLFNKQRDIYIQHPDREPELFDSENYNKTYKITINVGEQFEHYEFSDYNDKKGFISIFNKETFEAIIIELDTIKDFVEYLDEREKLLLSGKTITVKCKEKDLLAEYLMNARKFTIDYSAPHIKEIILNLEGAWEKYHKSESVKLKHEADRISYFIDHMVKNDILALPNGEVLARELMNLGRTERRSLAVTVMSLVSKYENTPGILARRYSTFNGIGHLIVYYPPDQSEENVDQMIKLAMEIYAYKTNYREKEIICIAATKGLKQYKFGMFTANPPIASSAKIFLDKMIENLGWFKDMKVIYHIEKEYPDQKN